MGETIKPWNKTMCKTDRYACSRVACKDKLSLHDVGDSDDIKIPDNSKNIIVLGAGPYRIGSSVEFDWGTVNMVLGLKKQNNNDVIVVNCNPETIN